MKLLQPMFLLTCLALAACGNNSGGGAPTSTSGGSTAGTASGTTSGSDTNGGATAGHPTEGNSTSPVTPSADGNATTGGNVTGDANGTPANGNVANANSTTGNTATGSATVTGTVAGQSFVPKSAIYGTDGNTVAVMISTDAQNCNSIATGSTLAASTDMQITLKNFTNGAEQAFGNGTYTVTSTVSQTAPSATVDLNIVDNSCKAVTVPGGSNASGGTCGVTAGGTSQHDDLKATFSVNIGATGAKLSGSFQAAYCDAYSKALAAGGVKSAACHP